MCSIPIICSTSSDFFCEMWRIDIQELPKKKVKASTAVTQVKNSTPVHEDDVLSKATQEV